MEKSVSIIIVSYRSYKDIKNCISTILHFLGSVKKEIIVIDNGSNECDILKLESDFDSVNLIALNENIGFAKANNRGVQDARFEYLCLLNPDTIIREDFLSTIIDFLYYDSTAGACAPMLLYENGKYQSSSGFRMEFIYEFFEATMMIELYRKVMRSKYLSLVNSNEPVKVGWISAACLVIRRSVFVEVGGFTEDFFLNYEDIDLCRRLEDHGYTNYYFPSLNCIHLDHKSFDNNFELLVYSRYQSRLIYAKHHYTKSKAFFIRILHVYGLLLRIIVNFFLPRRSGRIQRFNGYIKALKLYLSFEKAS